jgi:hypothetical protein
MLIFARMVVAYYETWLVYSSYSTPLVIVAAADVVVAVDVAKTSPGDFVFQVDTIDVDLASSYNFDMCL